MTSETLTCPYCNAQFKVTTPAGTRVVCPRCEVALPQRGSVGPTPGSDGAAQAGPLVQTSPRRSNRTIVRTLVLIMAGMAVVSLTFALWTIRERRQRDAREPTKVEVTAPANLRALGWLQPDCDIIIGVHVAELLQQPEGRELLTQLRLPFGDIGFEAIESWTGIALENLDHVVFGLNAEEGFIPRITVVARTRRPIDTRKVLAILKAEGSKPQGNKRLHTVKLQFLRELPSTLWFTDDEYGVVVRIPEGSLETVPELPHPGNDQILPPIRKLVREREPGTQIWAAGHIEDWQRTFVVTLMLAKVMQEKDAKALMGLRTFGAWLQLGQGLRFGGHFEGSDAERTDALIDWLGNGWRSGQAFGGRPEAKTLLDELNKNATTAKDKNTFTVRSEAALETVRKALER